MIRNGIQFLFGFLLLYQASFSQTDESIQQNFTIPFFSDSVTLIAAGDLFLGASAEHVIQSCGIHAPFDSLRFFIQKADITVANLEAPFAESGKGEPYPKQYNFKVTPYIAEGLVSAGFDVLTLANNHMMDYGEPALRSTTQVLDSLRLLHC
ncbi:MAG: CapA family protein, partial [Deltaproteobacteria bacterium]|nr:CapA family protein [Deltaproteobacteria bacterium]